MRLSVDTTFIPYFRGHGGLITYVANMCLNDSRDCQGMVHVLLGDDGEIADLISRV